MSYVRTAENGMVLSTFHTGAVLSGPDNNAAMISQYAPPLFDVEVSLLPLTASAFPEAGPAYFGFFGWWWDWQSRIMMQLIPQNDIPGGVLNLRSVTYNAIDGETLVKDIELGIFESVRFRIRAEVCPIGLDGNPNNFTRRWVFAYHDGVEWLFFHSYFEDWTGNLPLADTTQAAIYSYKLQGYSYLNLGNTFAPHFVPRIGIGISPDPLDPIAGSEMEALNFVNVPAGTPISGLPAQIVLVP